MVPEPLQIVIYRITKATFNSIALGTNTDRIQIAVQLMDDVISLTISDIPSDSYSFASVAKEAVEPEVRFAEIHDLPLLPRGQFAVKYGKASGVTLCSTWNY